MVLFVDKAAVLGAGVMGARIAEILALNGTRVILKDIDQAALDRGMAVIEKDLDELVAFHAAKADKAIKDFEKKTGVELTDDQKAKVAETLKPTYTEERKEKILANITPTTSYDGFDQLDLVIEAVVEKLPIKHAVYKELLEHISDHCVLASNTSTLPITELAAGLPQERRGRFIGVHFFNPPTQLPLVEIIPGFETRYDLADDIINFFAPMRNFRFPMLPIQVKEGPGFLVNRLLIPYLQEALACYEEGVASPKDIDLALQAGAGMPMGPLALMDLIGIDVLHDVCNSVMEQYGTHGTDPVKAAQVLRRLTLAGRLGQKSGQGFHSYND